MATRYNERRRNAANPYWSEIERLLLKRNKMTRKQAEFLTDLSCRGSGYQMTQKQIRWLNSLTRLFAYPTSQQREQPVKVNE